MSKGGDFERDISKYFTFWLTGKYKPYKFWRMPGSGGLATIHEECANLSGDIRSLDKDGEFLTNTFSIECKNGYPKSSFWQHFKDIKNFKLKDFWIQCFFDSKKAGKNPMLIYRKKGQKPIVGITIEASSLLNQLVPLNDLNNIIINWKDCDFPSVIFYSFEDFFNLVKPDDIKEIFCNG